MKDAMVDTMVLVYGTAGGGPKPADKVKRWVNDSRSLLLQMEQIRIATVTATEFLPFVRPDHAKAAAEIVARFRREAFDAAAEAVAIDLIREVRADPARCAVCLGVRKATPCKDCGNLNSASQRRNDIYIAATAATADGVRALYTYDDGILALAPHLPKLDIRHPPSTLGALFDRLEEAPPPASPMAAAATAFARAVGQPGDKASPARASDEEE